ncbi:hypothetical protein PInf_023593 [Phytophthora infestans]|nr:hypothetical protein PInf_023593 [Phytophthora infestans]
MMMTSQSFPVGKYARYKRATAFFLNWLARAGRRERGGNNLQLETFNDVVEEILANPSTLTTELLQECSKALAACQYAIELREHVASFFSEHDEGQASHQHFVELLRNWHRALKSVVMGRSKTIVQLEISERENYYEVLEVDDEYLPDEDSFSTAKQLPKATKVDRNPVLQEAFADGMKVEVVCFFSELDELMQGVCKAYGEVKREERTLVEATVVAKLAMDSASALTAQLQLKYPALRTSEDMYNVVRNIDPVKFRHRMATIHTKYLTDLQDSLLNGDGAVPYVPGMFLMDFLGVGTTLASFLTALPIDTTKSLEVPTGCFGEVYSEDRTPHYVLLPDPSKMNVFLLQQLPLLHKTIMEKKVTTGSGHDSSAPMESFMVLMEKYFTCREVTVPVVFTCICWIKSVAALQGDVGLGRNVSLTFRHSTELMRNIKETVAKGTVRKAHNKSNNLLQLCADEIKRSTGRRYLSRANPLLAGLTMLDHHFKYLHMASEILLVTSRFRSFGHVYNALVKEGYLEQISSLDDLLEVYSEMIFTPSRGAATRGSYYRTLLLSVDLRSASVDALCRGEGLPAGNEKFKKRKVLHLSDVSDTYRLMVRNDKSGLNRSSWASILDDAANICSKELSQTRVLSRDLLKLNDELANVYVELCAELKEGDWYGQTITDTGADLIEQQKMEDGLLQGSNGPLSKSDRSFIKAEIKKNSGLLGMIEPTPACLDTVEDSTNALDDNRLCTLLHQAAAGSAHDAELVEWMIQMGALVLQPTFHGQKQPQQNDVTCSKVLLSNAMAVHSAARAGYGDIVQILLEADQFADLNTPTLHTKETLRTWLLSMGIDVCSTLWFGLELIFSLKTEAGDTFLAGKYAQYKRPTTFFLDMLLRAHGKGRHAGQRVQLEALNDVVKETAADPSTFVYISTEKTERHLPLLYNALADRNVAVQLGHDLAPLGPFMAIMDTFFKTREVTLPVAFACICWMKFVAALQGRRGLGRNVSLTFQHSKDLQKRIEEAVENRKALLAYNKANSLLERCTGEIKHFVPLYHIARANPLFAGLTALNHQFQYLHIANEVLFATSKLRAFGHLYNALVQEGHLERNPFFDDVYDVYGQEVFAPSRAAAIHGAYYRTYLISSNLRVNLIEAVYRGEELPAPSEAYKKKKAFHLSDVSEIFRLSRLNDKSILKGGSWKDMLEDVANLCSRELFETRVLSRDLLKLNEDLTDLFPELVRVLGQQDCFSNIMDNSVAGESRQQRLSRALEESVMRKAMPLLDALQSDGSIDISAIPGAMSATVAMDALLGKELCSEIAAVINAKFSTTSEVCEQIYFTYPAQPDFVTQEYGGPDPDTRREDYEQVFED